jgi:hypothetical protein
MILDLSTDVIVSDVHPFASFSRNFTFFFLLLFLQCIFPVLALLSFGGVMSEDQAIPIKAARINFGKFIT